MKSLKSEALNEWSKWKRHNRVLYEQLLSGCEKCNSTEKLGIHHRDGDKMNNELDNLQCLCWNCHKKQHHKEIKIKYRVPEEPIYVAKPISKRQYSNKADELVKEYAWSNGQWIRKTAL